MGAFKRLQFARLASALGGAVLLGQPALAQRVDENVTLSSSDAFGRSVGNEKSGLYSIDDVRGFNPVDAGNVRIEGLYFDQVDRLSARLVDGNSIKVGLGARHVPFPAPTGLVDFRISVAEGEDHFTLSTDTGSTGTLGPSMQTELKLALDGDRAGIMASVGGRNIKNPDASRSKVRVYGGSLRLRPAPDAELLVFVGGGKVNEDEARPTLFPVGAALPPQIRRFTDLTQPWADRNHHHLVYGAIARVPLRGLKLEAGLFKASKHTDTVFADLLQGVAPDGSVANRVIIADGHNSEKSLSGELRLSRQFMTGAVGHQVTLGVKGRARDRNFGGSTRISLGPSTLLARDIRPEPAFTVGPKNHDRVRQLTPGMAYSMDWQGKASLDFSLARSDYRKRVDFADPLLGDALTHDRPLLWNLSGSYRIVPGLTAYAGIARGQEEALIAPDSATNRSESPPAIRTRQIEAGLSYALTSKLTLIAGAFSIAKPYYNLDPALRYRQLGTLTNRGIELSLTGELAPGLTLVGGTLFLDPRIAGEAVSSGAIGERPVGQVRRRSALNLDWRLNGGKGAWSLDLAVESYASRMANSVNTLAAPPRTQINLGARYRFTVGKTQLLLRPMLINVFNSYGWNVSSSGGFTYTHARAAEIQLIADF